MKIDMTPKDGKDFMKRILIIITIAVAAVLLYLWHASIAAFFAKCVKVLKPLIYAVVVAYILWPMMRFFEQKVFDRLGRDKPNKRLIRTLSLLMTYIIFILILVLFFSTVIPQIVDSGKTLADKAQGYVAAENARGVSVTGGGVAQVATTLYLALLNVRGDIEFGPIQTYGDRFADSYVDDGSQSIITDYSTPDCIIKVEDQALLEAAPDGTDDVQGAGCDVG